MHATPCTRAYKLKHTHVRTDNASTDDGVNHDNSGSCTPEVGGDFAIAFTRTSNALMHMARSRRCTEHTRLDAMAATVRSNNCVSRRRNTAVTTLAVET
jgi:hypothetical protein